MMANQAGNQMVQYSATSSGAVTPGAAGDEVRVDCCLMATDGRSVVTGSSLGPPQVWDMQVIQQARKTVQASSAETNPNFIQGVLIHVYSLKGEDISLPAKVLVLISFLS